MIEEFNKYVSNYDLDNVDIKLKYNHSIRVMNLSEKYAKLLGYDNNDIKLAKMIGLLHDIGRFEQLKVYGSYNDFTTIDHAKYGVKVLFEDNIIDKFTKDEREKEIIKFAIDNHNKFEIPKVKDEKMIMHAKLIRDTDKLDIIYLLGYLGELNLKATNEQITSKVKNDFFNHKCVKKNDVINQNDKLVMKFCFTYDINNLICLKELKDNYKGFYNQIDNNDIFKEILDEVNKYIDERID